MTAYQRVGAVGYRENCRNRKRADDRHTVVLQDEHRNPRQNARHEDVAREVARHRSPEPARCGLRRLRRFGRWLGHDRTMSATARSRTSASPTISVTISAAVVTPRTSPTVWPAYSCATE